MKTEKAMLEENQIRKDLFNKSINGNVKAIDELRLFFREEAISEFYFTLYFAKSNIKVAAENFCIRGFMEHYDFAGLKNISEASVNYQLLISNFEEERTKKSGSEYAEIGPIAYRLLGLLKLSEQETQDALSNLNAAAELGDKEASCKLGLIYKTGENAHVSPHF